MKKGFTLIELLIVIAIIGVLTSIVLSSISQSRGQSRNARRVLDIRSLQTAMEEYYLDNDLYPLPDERGSGDIQVLDPYLVPKYISGIPNDPKNDPNNYKYGWQFPGDYYVIYVPFGNDDGSDCKFTYPYKESHIFRVPECTNLH